MKDMPAALPLEIPGEPKVILVMRQKIQQDQPFSI